MKCYIMQGVPGSGKSTIAETYAGFGVIVSADTFFVKLGNGTYNFQPARLPDAHRECYLDFCKAVADGVAVVVVDNTNTTPTEIAPYERHATAFGYEVEIVRVMCDPVVAAARNTHGVPEKGVLAMHDRIQRGKNAMPPWWKVTEINNNPVAGV